MKRYRTLMCFAVAFVVAGCTNNEKRAEEMIRHATTVKALATFPPGTDARKIDLEVESFLDKFRTNGSMAKLARILTSEDYDCVMSCKTENQLRRCSILVRPL